MNFVEASVVHRLVAIRTRSAHGKAPFSSIFLVDWIQLHLIGLKWLMNFVEAKILRRLMLISPWLMAVERLFSRLPWEECRGNEGMLMKGGRRRKKNLKRTFFFFFFTFLFFIVSPSWPIYLLLYAHYISHLSFYCWNVALLGPSSGNSG